MNQKTLVAIIAVVIIIIGSIYYFSRNNYSGQNTLSPTSTLTPAPQDSSQISIKNFAFDPDQLNINKGETVTWINKDSTTHRISGNGFQSVDLTEGQSYSFAFNNAGTYDYICGIHPSMKGRVIVK